MAMRHEGVLGLTIKEAQDFLSSWSKYTLRWSELGQVGFVTADYDTNRLNVTTKDGIIISIEGFG